MAVRPPFLSDEEFADAVGDLLRSPLMIPGPAWIALHSADGAELNQTSAPGYRRIAFGTRRARWPATSARWGHIHYVSAWSAQEGGRCLSGPRLQPVRKAASRADQSQVG